MTLSSRIITYLFGAIFVLILIAKGLALWTDYLWFGAMGQSAVFTTILFTRVKLGVVVGLLFFLWLWLNLRHARKPLPTDIALIGKRLLPDEEREQIEEYADRALLVFALIGGLMAGLVASGKWLSWLQYVHGVDFGQVDPLFGKDVGFYVFKLGFLRYVFSSVFYATIIVLVASTLVHLYQEAIRVVGNTIQTITRARAHVYCLTALALLVKVVGYRLDQLTLTLSARGGVFYGASYADVYARLPVMWALMALCVIGAVVIVLNIRSRRLFWPAGALAVILLFSLLGGAAYPALVQRLVVLPNQLEKERPFIAHNIEATNTAFALDGIKPVEVPVKDRLTREDVESNRRTIDNIRLWDHRPMQRTINQTQALRAYYTFPDVDVDRYTIDGEQRQVMIAPRQIDHSRIPPPQTWVKDRLQYTHGYGVAVAPVNEVSAGEGGSEEGLPVYWAKDIPPETLPDLRIDRPGLYYYTSIRPRLIEIIQSVSPRPAPRQPPPGPGGATTDGDPPDRPGAGMQRVMDEPVATFEDYVIVNTDEWELDYSRAEGGNVFTRYEGEGGVPIGSFFRRLAFFARFYDLQILLTQSITRDSKIIINRTVPERIQALAPMFLIADPDPYIAVIEGKLVWITDTYTYSRSYPYSRPHNLVRINYMRNSVKVFMDAYDGIPKFHVVEPDDPMIQAYMKMFPTLFTTEGLTERERAHIRYPQLSFMVQAEMYADYHMLDPDTFYQREDSWSFPVELYDADPRTVEAYYVTMRLPWEEREEFLLMMPFTLRGREDRNMVAWLAGRCDGESYGELIDFRMPTGVLVEGPMQVEARIGQNREFSAYQTLWSREGSHVIRGNLLAIPVANSMLYVEPVYLAAADSAIPELKMVVLVNDKRVALGDSINDALSRLVGAPVGEPPPRDTRPRIPGAPDMARPPVEPDVPEEPVEPVEIIPLDEATLDLLDQVLELQAQKEAALAAMDLGRFQELDRQQAELLRRMRQQAE